MDHTYPADDSLRLTYYDQPHSLTPSQSIYKTFRPINYHPSPPANPTLFLAVRYGECAGYCVKMMATVSEL